MPKTSCLQSWVRLTLWPGANLLLSLDIVTSFNIWDHDHVDHPHHPRYPNHHNHHDHLEHWSMTRCVNDCLRVSEEKEVVSDGAAGGSRFVDHHDNDCDDDVDGDLSDLISMHLNIRTVRLATPPSDKLLSLTSGINSNLTALLSLLQVDFIIICHRDHPHISNKSQTSFIHIIFLWLMIVLPESTIFLLPPIRFVSHKNFDWSRSKRTKDRGCDETYKAVRNGSEKWSLKVVLNFPIRVITDQPRKSRETKFFYCKRPGKDKRNGRSR